MSACILTRRLTINQKLKSIKDLLIKMEKKTMTEVKAKMYEAVTLVIEYWPALRIAFERGWIKKNYTKIKDSDEIDSNIKKTVYLSDEQIKEKFVEDLTNYLYGELLLKTF